MGLVRPPKPAPPVTFPAPVYLHFKDIGAPAPYVMWTAELTRLWSPEIGDAVMVGAELYRVEDRVLFFTSPVPARSDMRIREIMLYCRLIPDPGEVDNGEL